MIIMIAHLPLYFYVLYKRAKGFKQALQIKDEYSIKVELILLTITIVMIFILSYIHHTIQPIL